jgi:hypothetical protein
VKVFPTNAFQALFRSTIVSMLPKISVNFLGFEFNLLWISHWQCTHVSHVKSDQQFEKDMVQWYFVHWNTTKPITYNALLTSSIEPITGFVSLLVQAYIPHLFAQHSYKRHDAV